ncbi:MAG: hypothetical protein HY928_07855 [Elusimicrobia bacterium]|nr:hypothetical protein [Elusimicrobiota bacterium]
MRFELVYTETAGLQRDALEKSANLAKRWKAVRKTLALMEKDLRHPGLSTHKFDSLTGPRGEDVFEAYAENKTPAAYRVFWHYGPKKGQITIVAITAHP